MFNFNSLCGNSPDEIERCITEVKNLEHKVSDLQDAFTLFMIHGDKLWDRENKKRSSEQRAKIFSINDRPREDQ